MPYRQPTAEAAPRWLACGEDAVPALLPPPVIAGFDPPMGGVPGLGEHTDAVLAELGLRKDEIAALRERGVIGGADA